MTKIAIIFVLVLGFALPSTLTPDSARAHISCLSFAIDNESSDTIGFVFVSGLSDSVGINVTGTGYFHGDICSTPVSVTINNQNVLYPNIRTVVLSNGNRITVSWASNSLIDIKNIDTQDGPMR
jgi:hypothetical protein